MESDGSSCADTGAASARPAMSEENPCHFASPNPRSAARASTSPKPNVLSRPAVPRSTAVFSRISFNDGRIGHPLLHQHRGDARDVRGRHRRALIRDEPHHIETRRVILRRGQQERIGEIGIEGLLRTIAPARPNPRTSPPGADNSM